MRGRIRKKEIDQTVLESTAHRLWVPVGGNFVSQKKKRSRSQPRPKRTEKSRNRPKKKTGEKAAYAKNFVTPFTGRISGRLGQGAGGGVWGGCWRPSALYTSLGGKLDFPSGTRSVGGPVMPKAREQTQSGRHSGEKRGGVVAMKKCPT